MIHASSAPSRALDVVLDGLTLRGEFDETVSSVWSLNDEQRLYLETFAAHRRIEPDAALAVVRAHVRDRARQAQQADEQRRRANDADAIVAAIRGAIV